MSVIPRVQYVSLQPPPDSRVQAAGAGAGRARPMKAIVMPREELDRIKGHSQWLAKQAQDGLLRQAQVEHMKTASKNLVKNWKNTVLNKQKERLQRRLKRIQDEDDRKNAIYQMSVQQAAEDRKKKIEDARRMILFDKDDIHQVNSAYVFSEVLHERAKQLEFNQQLSEVEKKAKEAMAERIKRDVQTYHEEEAQQKAKEHAAKMERKAENIKMMKEKAEREAMLLSGEKEFEKQDLIDMAKEIKQVEENIQAEIRRKKEHVKKDALESIDMKKEAIKLQKQEDEDEEKVIQIYLRVKDRMEQMRQQRELEARKAKHEHQERIRNIIAESLKQKEDDVDGMIAKALREREEREAEVIRKRKEYEEKLIKEQKDYKLEVQERKKKEGIEEKELKQWVLMQRMRRDEIDKLHEIKKKESQWATKMNVRQGYNEQLVEQRAIKCKEEEEELKRFKNLIKQLESEDAEFFKYAQEVLDECKSAGRPLYPVQKAVHEYRKRHGIINKEKYEKWAKERAAQEQRDREEEELYSMQLATLDESPKTSQVYSHARSSHSS